MKRQEKGFSIIEIILVVAVVVLLGFVGWRVWEAKKDKGNNAQNTEQQNQQANEQKQDELNPDGYLHIKELGVKIKLTEGIRDAVYSYGKLPNGVEFASFSTASLVEKSESCKPSASTTPLGFILKSPSLDSSGEVKILENPDGYFYYNRSQASCGDSSSWDKLKALENIMAEQAKMIETETN